MDPLAAGEPEGVALQGQARIAPAEPFALKGCVVIPDEAIEDGYVVISEATITDVTRTPPTDMRLADTNGVILPGLIDLHGHPEYNVFSPWEPPRLFSNRYQWRASEEYAAVVKGPWALLTEETDERPSLLRALTRYAEARALIGGTTAIQGASGVYPDPHESLVRNVDRYIFGAHIGRSIIDLGRTRPEDVGRLKQQIEDGLVGALYIHLAEGIDESSRREFEELEEVGLLTPATVIIHGTALDDNQLERVKEAGAKLVWSPQSNLRLYGETT
ncbi:MAG: amidohydrolase, partial [Actinomycetota bacterium]|nr:amidohydrolase [Actinomycetota bacterium]